MPCNISQLSTLKTLQECNVIERRLNQSSLGIKCIRQHKVNIFTALSSFAFKAAVMKHYTRIRY